LPQLLSKVIVTSCSFTSNVQCVHLAAGRRTQAGDATDCAIDQWRRRLETTNTLFPVVNFLKCVVTEVVLLSIDAFKTLDVSQGSLATHLGCGGIFSDSIITDLLLILVMK